MSDKDNVCVELLRLPDELLLDIVRCVGGDLQSLYSSCRRLRELMLPRIGSAFIELREAADDDSRQPGVDGGMEVVEDGLTQLQVCNGI